ncbi:MAG TPA: DnaJ domain-containing protein [Xanthomonadaceae bacterium]|jgi:hypothetical protein|nr:DnaJ domain-containing protein [Xanthomonadaceae bacterium]
MNPFQALGIPANADIETIKKAYAKLLRQHRPDEDPVGFQRIHEAYQACLAVSQRAALRQQQQSESSLQKPVQNAHPIDSDDNKASESTGFPPAETAQPVPPPSSLQPAGVMRPPLAPEPVAIATQPSPMQENIARQAQEADSQSEFVADRQPSPRQQNPPSKPPTPALTKPPDRVEPEARPQPHPPATPEPARTNSGAPRRIQFQLVEFADALCEQDRGGQVALQTWLQRCEPLYALDLKQAVTVPLLQLLAKRTQPLSPDGLLVVLTFLGLNTVSPERRSLEGLIQLLQNRSRAAWSIRQRSEPTRPVATAARKIGGRANWFDKLVALELVKPLNVLRRAGILLIPRFKTRMRSLLAEISQGIDPLKEPMFNKGAVTFWRDVLDPARVSKWRILSMCTSVAVLMVTLWFLADGSAGPVGFAGIGALILLGWLAVATINASTARRGTKKTSLGKLGRLVAREFQQPRNLYRRAAILLTPGLRGTMRRVIGEIQSGADRSRAPTVDKNALDFWTGVLDPRRVSKWRILAACTYIAAVVLIVGVMSHDLTLVTVYAIMGLVFLCGWLALAANDAHKARNAKPPPRPTVSRSGRVNRGGTGGGTSWRWVIGAIIAMNALLHALTNH